MTTTKKSKNLIEGLQDEISRVKEIIEEYRSIGMPGNFARVMMERDVDRAEKAIGEGDVIKIGRLIKELQCYDY